MPLPDSVAMVTVTEDYSDAAAGPCNGTVAFTPSVRVGVAGSTITVDKVVARVVNGVLLGPDGKSPLRLVANDSPGISPTGWTYRVEPSVGRERTPRNIVLPATPGTVVLHTLSPVDPVVPGDVRVLTVDGIGPDSAGNIDLPGSGGGILSVNDQTPDGEGNVTLTAADVGALTQTAGDTRYVQPAALDPYATDADLTAGLAGKAATAHTHPQSDVVGLAAALTAKADLVAGKIPQAQLPAIAVVDYLGVAADQAAMLALTGQRGDWTNRTDLGTTWQLIADDSTQLTSWLEHNYPDSPVSSVAGRTGAITLTKTDVGLSNVDNTADLAKPVSNPTQTALDGKENTGTAAAAVTAHTAASDPHPQYARRLVVRQAWITSGDANPLPNTAGIWSPLAGYELSIPAAVGDYVDIGFSGLRNGNANSLVDIGVLVGPAIVRYLASGSATPGFEGDPAWYPPSGGLIGHPDARGFTVAGGDRDGGNVRFAIVAKSNGTGRLYSSADYPFYWRARNHGPVN